MTSSTRFARVQFWPAFDKGRPHFVDSSFIVRVWLCSPVVGVVIKTMSQHHSQDPDNYEPNRFLQIAFLLLCLICGGWSVRAILIS